MNEYVKTLAPRFALIFILFALFAISFFFFGMPAFIALFVCLFFLMLLNFIVDYVTNGAFALWKFSKMKELGWYKVEPDLELVAGEKILYPLAPAYVRMSAAGYSFMPRDIIITNKRVAMGFDVFGVKEVFGEINLWQVGMSAIPQTKKKITGGVLAPLGSVKVKEAKLNKSGKAVLITVNQLGISILIEIFHPKAREICEILSE